ncbi:MAG: hypothetical protein WCA80_10520 [Candidatus Aquilonibacter sp.]
MYIQRLPLVVALVTALLATSAPASAARIYNLLPMPVQMSGQHGDFILRPGQKSDSLSWTVTGLDIIIHGIGRTPPICSLNWFPRHEIAGGHYLIIGHHGYQTVCSLCDSDGKLMQRATGTVPVQYYDVFKGSTKTGC